MSSSSSLTAVLGKLLGISDDDKFYALIIGPSGVGKTVYTYQALWSYLQEGKAVVYQSTEEPPSTIIQRMKKQFGWDIQPFLDSKMLCFMNMQASRIDNVTKPINEEYGVRLPPMLLGGLGSATETTEMIMSHLKIPATRFLFDCISSVAADFEGGGGSEKFVSLVSNHVARLKRVVGATATMTRGVLPAATEDALLSLFDVVVEAKMDSGPFAPKRFFRINKSSLGPCPAGWFEFKITSKGFEIYAKRFL